MCVGWNKVLNEELLEVGDGFVSELFLPCGCVECIAV